MDDLLQKETERQRRLLEEARKAVEQEKARLRQGGARRIEPQLDEPAVRDSAASQPRLEPVLRQSESQQVPPQQRNEPTAAGPYAPYNEAARPPAEVIARLRSIPDMRSALIPLDENMDGAAWSKPFSLPKADMEPWLSFLRGYRESCLFPDAAAAGRSLRVDAAVQALLDLKGIDIKVILEPAVQINGPVEYQEEMPADASVGSDHVHASRLAKAVDKGREMGNHLYDALLGEGYVNLAQAWEKVHGRKPNVSELHFMLTTGRVMPPVEIQPRQSDVTGDAPQPNVLANAGETTQKRQGEAQGRKTGRKRSMTDVLSNLLVIRACRALPAKFRITDKRKFLFHLSHLVLVFAVIIVYCVVMRVFD